MEEINDYLGSKVKELFGLDYLFPYQRLVITNILEAAQTAVQAGQIDNGNEQSDRECMGRQIVILPTGAGKSLCFQLPAMLLEGITLVIYPILSLMADQERRLHERGFNPVILRGEQSKEDRKKIWDLLHTGKSRFIIANPEILLTPQVKEQLKNIRITHIVIDEAHCVSEWGESFRPSYLEIGSIITDLSSNPLAGTPLVTAFTATASASVLEKIKRYIFCDLDAHQIVGNPDRPNICYTAKGCINRNLAVRDLLIQNERPAIVFCSSRPGTERLARYLRTEFAEMGFAWHNEVRFYHAGLSREEKTAVEKWFINNPQAVLCATCAYGMGVDKADVRTVIHRDCAPTVEAYLQEAGRAGRDGGQSKAILLWGPEDKLALERCKTDVNRSRLLALLNYAKDINQCRRHALLKLLDYDSGGEVPEKFCCDVCEKEASDTLREENSVLEFIRKNKRRYTASQAAAAMTSGQTVYRVPSDHLQSKRLDSFYQWSKEDACAVISYLLETGRLKEYKRFLWKNKITL